jgi:cytochrome c556
MMRLVTFALAAATASIPALAQDMSPAEQAHALRQYQMRLQAANLGPLVAMARGEAEYDADVAALRAGNIVAYTSANVLPYFPEGSSSDDLAESRALPIIWENVDDFGAKFAATHEAAQAVVAAAPNGQEAFAAAFGALGQACGSCHETYRKPQD